MKSMRLYVAVLGCLAIVIPAVVVAINVAVDPYAFFGTKLVSGFNVLKPEMGLHEKEQKLHTITSLRPDGLVLGASTSDVGIDPGHAGWTASNVYNLSAGQSSISLVHHFLLHALEFEVPKQLVLGLEMGMFNPSMQVAGGIKPASFAVGPDGERNREYLALNYYGNAFSLDMLVSSFAVIAANRAKPVVVTEHRPQISATGMMNPENFAQSRWKTPRAAFQRMVMVHVDTFWAPHEAFRDIQSFQGDPTFAEYEDILRLACENEIELSVVFSPAHAYLLEAKEMVGLTEVWERWKSAVVLAAAAQSDSGACAPIRVWDFSGYNVVTTEVIADERAAESASLNYWDPVHYRKEVGDSMLNRIFDIDDEVGTANFGVLLTPDNLDSHLAATRLRGLEYRNTHPLEIEAVERTVGAALKTGSK